MPPAGRSNRWRTCGSNSGERARAAVGAANRYLGAVVWRAGRTGVWGHPAANAYADAALARLAESDLRDDPDAAYLAMDVDRLASDCRWAAGRADEALPTCTQPSRDMTMWSAGVSRSRRG